MSCSANHAPVAPAAVASADDDVIYLHDETDREQRACQDTGAPTDAPDAALFSHWDGTTKRHFHNNQLPGPLVSLFYCLHECVRVHVSVCQSLCAVGVADRTNPRAGKSCRRGCVEQAPQPDVKNEGNDARASRDEGVPRPFLDSFRREPGLCCRTQGKPYSFLDCCRRTPSCGRTLPFPARCSVCILRACVRVFR